MYPIPEDETEPVFEKNQVIERLTLETTITSQFVRLCVFLVQLYIFVVNLQQFYPSDKINFAHKSIMQTLGLEDLPTEPTGPELLEFMQELNGRMSSMAPNSKAWVSDPQMRKLIPDPVAFSGNSPPHILSVEQEPELTVDFTALAWVRSALSLSPVEIIKTLRFFDGFSKIFL